MKALKEKIQEEKGEGYGASQQKLIYAGKEFWITYFTMSEMLFLFLNVFYVTLIEV